MTTEINLKEEKRKWHGSYKSYAIGFVASFALTAASFWLVIMQVFPKQILIYSIVALALVQAIIQLLFFLHLGKEDAPRWESWIFYFMVFILLIIVVGSLWIMHDLDQRMMSNMHLEVK